jgi:predicted NUDIX family NTP pyrophosphohydrolase
MPKKSAGILLYRLKKGFPEVFLVHPGGPFFTNKDLGAWSVPKGEYEDDEQPLVAAKREFLEETGIKVDGPFVALSPVRLKSGKVVIAYALEFDLDESAVKSNLFELEWPPRSGKKKFFPEIDRGAWFTTNIAKQKINPAQTSFIDQLLTILPQ